MRVERIARALSALRTTVALVVLAVSSARADDPATVGAVAPAFAISPAHPTVGVPVTLTRTATTPMLGFSVTLTVASPLTLPAGAASITEGDFLSASGGTTSPVVTDLGGGVWRVDAVTLGAPCGSSALSGTLFTLTLASAAPTALAAVTITSVTLRDCANAPLPGSIGAAADVTVDQAGPTVTLGAPNGGETWSLGSQRTITWTADDPAGVASVDLEYSVDGGASWPHPLASGLANSGTYAWTVSVPASANARVRVTAHDALGNASTDASDADFTVRAWRITASAGPDGQVAPSGITEVPEGGSASFTITPDAGHHVGDVLVDGVSVGTPGAWEFTNVASDHTLAASFAANPAVAPITALLATPVHSGNDADGTIQLAISWPALPSGSTVEVWRAPFGGYPRYEHALVPGAEPELPSYPPTAPWTLTPVTASGQTDEPSTRDFWYHVAFVTDGYGTRSPVSNRTAGALDYVLGDVWDGAIAGAGDNLVTLADVSLLGSHYGLTGASALPFDYLDVGPTTDWSPAGRPTSDGSIDFEDLVLFGMNYGYSSSLRSAPLTTADATLAMHLEAHESEGVWTASVRLAGGEAVAAISTRLGWNAAVVTPEGFAPGDAIFANDALALSPRAGAADVLAPSALPGAPDAEIARFRFRRVGPGDPALAIERADARDASNGRLGVALPGRHAGLPLSTSLAPARPSPFRGETELGYALARAGSVELAVYGVDGRLLRSLASGVHAAGDFRVAWDGRDGAGRRVAPGVYFVRLRHPGGQLTRTVVRLP